MLWQLLFIPTPTPLPEFILSIPGDPESHIWGRLSPNQSPETIQNTPYMALFSTARLEKMQLCWEYFGLFLVSDWDCRGQKCVIQSPFGMVDRIVRKVGTGIN